VNPIWTYSSYTLWSLRLSIPSVSSGAVSFVLFSTIPSGGSVLKMSARRLDSEFDGVKFEDQKPIGIVLVGLLPEKQSADVSRAGGQPGSHPVEGTGARVKFALPDTEIRAIYLLASNPDRTADLIDVAKHLKQHLEGVLASLKARLEGAQPRVGGRFPWLTTPIAIVRFAPDIVTV